MPRIDNDKLERMGKRAAEYKDRKASNMSKREWMAGMAMQGILAKSSGEYIDEQQLADFSVICADELIKQLEKDV